MSFLFRLKVHAVLAAVIVVALATVQYVRIQAANAPSPHALKLNSGERFLTAVESDAFLKISGEARGGILQFDAVPIDAQRESLRALGVELGSYMPDYAFIASVPGGVTARQLEAAGVRWAGTLSVDDKVAEALRVYGTTPEWSVDKDGIPRFSMGLFPHVDLKDAERWMAAEYGARIIGTSKLGHSIEVALPGDNWQEVAADPRIVWLEPFWPRVAHNNSNRADVNADAAQAVPYNLSGTGVVVGEWDEGRADPSHADFGGRILSADASAISTHSTHVAGTVLGGGASPSFTYKGMAPLAGILSHEWWFSASEMETEYQGAIDNVDMRISTNSWGVGFSPPSVSNCNAFVGNYFAECASLDNVARGMLGKPVTIVWSAGNERSTGSQYCGSVGFTWGTVTPFGTAKNVLTIGAINSNNSTMTGFSSWGPTDDGRLKPELVGPGCQSNSDFGVTSTKPGTGYTVFCGTSMSAPTVSGCVALWTQRWMLTRPDVAFASTVKAAFVESADELGDLGPEYDWGFGRVDVVAAVDLLDQNRLLEDSIAHGETKSWTFVNNGALPMISVTLAWDDPGAAENAAVTLINNLNLRLIPPSGPAQYLPWTLDPANPSLSATTGVDNRNNIEQVRRTSGLEVGTWVVEVTGANIPVGPQRFSLAFATGMSLTSTVQAYAVSLEGSSNPSSLIGVAGLPFVLGNNGFTNDTYDVALTSSHGWSIASNPRTIALGAYSDSALSFDLTIPPATPYGTVDTIIALAESQGSPPLSSTDTMFVTVVSGRAVAVLGGSDSLGVVGRTIQMTARLLNLGVADDSIEWTAGNTLGWTINPPTGVAAIVSDGFADVTFAVTIDEVATPGTSSAVIIAGASLDDPAATDADTMSLLALARPPVPVPVYPANLALLNITTPTLRWTHNAYTPPPPGWDVFSYYVDIADDAGLTINSSRLGPLSDTFTVTPSLPDGVHHWRILTFNAFGDSGLPSAVEQFEIDTQAPSAPTLDQPGDSLYEADTTLSFSWQVVPDAGQYKWELASDAAFTANRDSAWTSATSYARMLASCSTVVYWRVTAADAAGNQSMPSASHRYAIYQVGDINFDCVLNIIDVVGMIEVAFRGGAFPTPPGRAEMLCNPPTDITDVIRLIDIVFRGGVPPCGPQ